MEEPFDYSQVPFTFGMCAAENCPQASTCLRQIALKHAPANKVFLPIMNPNHIKGIKEKCDYFCSNEKVRYAKGFMCTINALTVRVANTFRYRMIGYLGRKNYYLKRSGKLALTPAEQQWIINTAKELGVIQSEYLIKSGTVMVFFVLNKINDSFLVDKRKYPRRETTVSSSGNHRVLVRERQGNCNHLLYKTLV